MATVDFTINSKSYSVDCGTGQEKQILSIVQMIDKKAKELAGMFGEVDSETLLLMVNILVFGDLDKAKNKLTHLENTISELKSASTDDENISNFIIDLSKKVKAISTTIENELSLNS